jgi:ribosomal protein S18 acetylase RimI-like enzyme
VLALGVIPSYQRRGLGRALIKEVAERVRGAGLGRTELTVAAENLAARALYDGLGFRVVDRYSTFVWSERN